MKLSVSSEKRVMGLSGRTLGQVTLSSVVLAMALAGCASQPTAGAEPGAAVPRGNAPAVKVNGAAGAPGATSTGAASGQTTSGRPSAGGGTATSTSLANPAAAPAATPPPDAAFTWPSAVLDSRPASHLAAGKRRVAAIVTDADGKRRLVVFALPEEDRQASHALLRVDVALPVSLQTAPVDSFSLFMGRDDWPRVIVTPPPSPRAITYHRYRPLEGWTSPTDEQGALAAKGRAFGYYGLLGHIDPEVLCVPDVACYEKRTRGWTKRGVPGPGVWDVTLTSEIRDSSDVEPWAWSSTAAVGPLLQLDGEWHERVPRLSEPVVGFATWGRAYFVALTRSGLYRYAPPASQAATTIAKGQTSDDSARREWSLIANVEQGNVLFHWPLLSGMLVGTVDGLLRLLPSEPRVERTLVTVDAKTMPTGTIRAIGATIEGWPRYLVACDAGLLLLGDLNRDPRGAL